MHYLDNHMKKIKFFIDTILKNFEGFGPIWDKHVEYWSDEPDKRTLCLDIAEFSHFVRDLISAKKENELKKVADLIEELIPEDPETDEDLYYSVKKCFLENITNLPSDEGYPVEIFIAMLGPKSRKICKDLDIYWGSTTKGLNCKT